MSDIRILNTDTDIVIPEEDVKIFLDDSYYLKNGSISRRLNSQLFYVYFNFKTDLVKSELFKEDFIKMLKTYSGDGAKDYEGNNILSFFLSLNAISVNLPQIQNTYKKVRLFNINEQLQQDIDIGDSMDISFVEDNNFIITTIFTRFLYANHKINSRSFVFYPDDLCFDIYVVPLRLLRGLTKEETDFVKSSNISSSALNTAEFYKNCRVVSISDKDFDIHKSVDTSIVQTVFNYEERFIYNKVTLAK